MSPTQNKLKKIRTKTEKGDGVYILRREDNGPLHDLLLDACPPDAKGRKSISVLAGLLGIEPWSIHKWIKKKKIPAGRANQIVSISEGRTKIEDLLPFILNQT